MSAADRIADYKNLDAWCVSMRLVRVVYQITACMPPGERFGLIGQMRRAAVSIPSNIAEGYGRVTPGDYARFARVARGSAAELETQVLIAVDLGMLGEGQTQEALALVDRVKAMLHNLVRRLESRR